MCFRRNFFHILKCCQRDGTDQWRIQDFREGASTPDFERKPIIWQGFCRKLHKKWKKLNREGRRCASLATPWIRQCRLLRHYVRGGMCFTSCRYNSRFNNTISSTYLLQDKKNCHPFNFYKRPWNYKTKRTVIPLIFTKDHEITSIIS